MITTILEYAFAIMLISTSVPYSFSFWLGISIVCVLTLTILAYIPPIRKPALKLQEKDVEMQEIDE